jgi:hypothetical protein
MHHHQDSRQNLGQNIEKKFFEFLKITDNSEQDYGDKNGSFGNRVFCRL